MVPSDGDYLKEEWQRLFIPSSDLYLATLPQERSDFRVKGRGLTAPGCQQAGRPENTGFEKASNRITAPIASIAVHRQHSSFFR
jgi:hypothetical protein